MRLVLVLVLACGGVPALPGGPPADPPAAASDPAGAEALISEVYRPYLQHQGGTDLPRSGKLAAGLQIRWDAAQKAADADGGFPPIGFDPVTDAQDDDLSHLALSTTASAGGATVEARFDNFGQPATVTWILVQEGGGWRIANVRSATWDLEQALSKR